GSAGMSETGEPTTGPDEPPPPIEGYADLHLHMMAEAAFGGGWFHGNAMGAEDIALAMCDGGFPGDHARARSDLTEQFTLCNDQSLPIDLATLAGQIPVLNALLFLGGIPASELLGKIEGTDGDTGLQQNRKNGLPDFSGWPRWDTIAHQQSWEGWLKQAHGDGLRVVVMSAVSFDWLCTALPPGNLDRPQCDEMDDVRVQLEMANELDAANDWLEIALSAGHARKIASEGKLAMILSIEASSIFGDGDWLAQLDEVYALGVRTLQIVHQFDNRFGGAAPHNTIFHVAQFTRNCHVDSDCGLTTPALTLGFDVDAECKNVQGLTDEGAALVDEMMDRGMLIDAAHTSERTFSDIYALAEANTYYPLYMSHGHFREIMTPPKQREEKTTPVWIVEALRKTGGVFGLRTAHEEVNAYPASSVANDCHGSTRSLAQAYAFGQLGLKVDIALGSDFNGFIQQTRPRFGDNAACSASFADEATCQKALQELHGPPPLGSALDTQGFAHIGL
ncbi:MAG TPA: membrane dipeptidase, partial [Nannocystis sp.]